MPYSPLPVACCVLPTAYCVLPIACCVLSTAYFPTCSFTAASRSAVTDVTWPFSVSRSVRTVSRSPVTRAKSPAAFRSPSSDLWPPFFSAAALSSAALWSASALSAAFLSASAFQRRLSFPLSWLSLPRRSL